MHGKSRGGEFIDDIPQMVRAGRARALLLKGGGALLWAGAAPEPSQSTFLLATSS